MITPLDKIFSKFLHQIDDVEFALIDNVELEEILVEFLENSIIDFEEYEGELNIIPSYYDKYEIEHTGVLQSQYDYEKNTDTELDSGFTNDSFATLEIPLPNKPNTIISVFNIVSNIDPDFDVEGYNISEIEFDNSENQPIIEYSKIQLVEDDDYTLLYIEEEEKLYIKFLKPLTNYESLLLEVASEGYIDKKLTLDEIAILAYGMVLSWLNPKIRREENLRQLMNDRDFKQLSNANMLAKLIDLHSYTRRELELRRQRYSLKNFKGFD